MTIQGVTTEFLTKIEKDLIHEIIYKNGYSLLVNKDGEVLHTLFDGSSRLKETSSLLVSTDISADGSSLGIIHYKNFITNNKILTFPNLSMEYGGCVYRLFIKTSDVLINVESPATLKVPGFSGSNFKISCASGVGYIEGLYVRDSNSSFWVISGTIEEIS